MRFRFGVFELDEEAGELRRAGAPVRIQPKPFELLSLLVRERARVVEFDELMRALWPDTIVSPASLNRAVSHARRAIDDTGRGVALKSVARRGYRFVADVVELGGHTAASSDDVADTSGAVPEEAPALAKWTRDAAGFFVGRRDARARLAAAESAVVTGEARVAVVSGPPGIGKTRLVGLTAEHARQQGFFVVVGRCRDREGAPAFWLWSQVLRSLVTEAAFSDALSQAVRAGELESLVPAIRDFAPDLLRDIDVGSFPPLGRPSEEDRFRFFDAATHALRICARLRPIVLVLEDVQWAGSGSLRLLEHIALEFTAASVLLIATVRDEPRERRHPVESTLALLRQQPYSESIELSGLSRGEVGELLRAALGGDRPAPVDLVSELYARTEGVPFFVGEAIRMLDERGDLARPERIPRHGVALPPRAIDLIRRSIDAVSGECLSLLGAGAVLGRSFGSAAAVAIGEIDRATSLDLLDEAIRAGILEESDEGAATYRFVHALFQEAIYDGLSASLRARLHRSAARRLEQQHAEALDPVLAELAHHHHNSIEVGEPERACDTAILAARQAEDALAWEQAAMHYEQALASFEHMDRVDADRRVETLLALGEAHRLSGNRERRIAAFDEAVQVARSLGSHSAFTRAAVGLCDVAEWSARVPDHCGAVLEEALSQVAPDDVAAQARLTTRLAYLVVRDPERAEPLGRRGLELARASGDAAALQESLYILLYILCGPDHLDEREELSAELEGASKGCANRDAGVIALLDLAADGLMQGDLEKARRFDALAADVGGRHPSPTTRWHRSVWNAGLALLEGRFAEAEQGIHDAVLLGRRIAHPFAGACFSGQRSVLDRERGAYHDVIDRLERTIDHTGVGATHWATAFVGRTAAAAGDAELANRMLARLADEGFDRISRTVRWNGSVAEAALLTAESNSDAHAAALFDLLATAPGQHGLLPMVVSYSGPLSRPMAMLSERLGRADEAVELFDEALEQASAIGARPTVARIQLEAAPLIARSGDAKRAAAFLADSAALAGSLGMPHVEEAARRASDRI